ncbi:MAG: hypothetical protein K1060chlam2_01200 [Chlamydiae bacterium]|nr:hypothetical protein [Chlamydiota bacterium]
MTERTTSRSATQYFWYPRSRADFKYLSSKIFTWENGAYAIIGFIGVYFGNRSIPPIYGTRKLTDRAISNETTNKSAKESDLEKQKSDLKEITDDIAIKDRAIPVQTRVNREKGEILDRLEREHREGAESIGNQSRAITEQKRINREKTEILDGLKREQGERAENIGNQSREISRLTDIRRKKKRVLKDLTDVNLRIGADIATAESAKDLSKNSLEGLKNQIKQTKEVTTRENDLIKMYERKIAEKKTELAELKLAHETRT